MHHRCPVTVRLFLLLLYNIAIRAQDRHYNAPSILIEPMENVRGHYMGCRIVGGIEANQANAKYQVSIRSIDIEEYRGFGVGHQCGGCLIGADIILTAAHCFDHDEPNELVVVMGSLDRLDEKNNLSFKIKGVAIHPGYDKKTLFNDIAVVCLSRPVPSDNENIKPIEINRKPVEKGTICQVSGWGLMENSTDEFQLARILLSACVSLIPKCENTRINRAELSAGMICAGDIEKGGKGSCNGDSGGPLVCNGLLTGIVSWAVTRTCELPDFPTVYTKVDYYQAWIDEQTRQPCVEWKRKPKNGSVRNFSPIGRIIALGIGAALV